MRVAQILLGKNGKGNQGIVSAPPRFNLKRRKKIYFFPFFRGFFFPSFSLLHLPRPPIAHIRCCTSCSSYSSNRRRRGNLQLQRRRQHSIFVFPPLRPWRQFFIVYHISEGLCSTQTEYQENIRICCTFTAWIVVVVIEFAIHVSIEATVVSTAEAVATAAVVAVVVALWTRWCVASRWRKQRGSMRRGYRSSFFLEEGEEEILSAPF